jgi:hypothetical protein
MCLDGILRNMHVGVGISLCSEKIRGHPLRGREI